MPAEFLNPASLCPTFGWTHVVTVSGGKTIYISGQVGINEKGEVVGKGDLKRQTDRVVVHIEIALGRHHDGDTAVSIAYTSTPTDEASRAILATARESDWLETMHFWEGSMNAWFDKQRAAAA